MTNTPITRPNELVYISLKAIQPLVDDIAIPKKHMEREQLKVTRENTSSTLPEVTFSSGSGKYVLLSGYTTYYVYRNVHKSNKLIPCKVYYHLPEDECYFLTLDWMFKSPILNWRNRHVVITKLTKHFQYTIDDLSTFLHRSPNSIRQYLDPPSHVEAEARLQNKERIINKISHQAFWHSHNIEYLYNLILHFNIHITDDQLKFIGWMRGNGIQFEKCNLSEEQEKQLIDKALNLKPNFLEEIRYIINRMRVSNGDSQIF